MTTVSGTESNIGQQDTAVETAPIPNETIFFESLLVNYFPAPAHVTSIHNGNQRLSNNSVQRNYDRQKQSVIGRLERSNIPKDEIPSYLESLYGIANLLSADEHASLDDFRKLIVDIPSYDIAIHFGKYAQQWRDEVITLDMKTIQDKNDANMQISKDNATFFDIVNVLGGKMKGKNDDKKEEIDELWSESLYAFKTAKKYADNPQTDLFLSPFSAILEKKNSRGQLSIYTHIFERTMANFLQEEDIEPSRVFLAAVETYMLNHNLVPEDEEILISKLLLSIKSKEKYTDIFYTNAAREDSHRGDIGEANFIIKTYLSPITPVDIAKLIIEAGDVPIVGRHNLIINDAIEISPIFPNLRTLIHRNKRAIREASDIVINYYNDHNKDELQSRLNKLVGKPQAEVLYEELVDLEKYDSFSSDWDSEYISPINLLYEINNEAQFLKPLPPRTGNAELDANIEKLGNISISTEDLGKVCSKVNSILIKKIENKEKGLDPSFILALSWINTTTAEFLHNLSYEEILGIHKMHWFQSILQFHELISAGSHYDNVAFEQWSTKLAAMQDIEEANHAIQLRAIHNSMELKNEFELKGLSDKTKYLWTDSIIGELISLTQERPAKTQIGKKLQEEESKRIIDPGYHPGD